MCRGGELNTRRSPLQGDALPLSYRGAKKSLFALKINCNSAALCILFEKLALVVQRIERGFPKPEIGVRFLAGPLSPRRFACGEIVQRKGKLGIFVSSSLPPVVQRIERGTSNP